MNCLLLGSQCDVISHCIVANGDHIEYFDQALDEQWLSEHSVDFLISYGYRHIIRAPILHQFPNKVINLHISYLPWNRGADPNLWSFLDDTIKGVTIHYVDPGIDTGDIIAQEKVEFPDSTMTLATAYHHLHRRIQSLFSMHWPAIARGTCSRKIQTGLGSTHRQKDKMKYQHILESGWNTQIGGLSGLATHGSD